MADSMRTAKKRRITGNIITLAVGKDSSDLFHAHESILKENSDFFRAALDKQWKEGIERKVELPDDTAEVVAAYVEWLYSRKLATISESETGGVEYKLLANLYVFGEKVQDDTFCNAAMEAMMELLGDNKFPNPAFYKCIYTGTPETSPARLFAIHIVKDAGLQDWLDMSGWKEYLMEIPEFLFDLSRAQLPVERNRGETLAAPKMRCDEWFKKR